jgi:hypothetical protein
MRVNDGARVPPLDIVMWPDTFAGQSANELLADDCAARKAESATPRFSLRMPAFKVAKDACLENPDGSIILGGSHAAAKIF